MISKDELDRLRRAPTPRAEFLLYVCPDGTREIVGEAGGSLYDIGCDNPAVYPLAGGPITGLTMREIVEMRGTMRENPPGD